MKYSTCLAAVAIFLSILCVISQQKTFHNHKLYSVQIGSNQSAIEVLSSVRDEFGLDFWEEPCFGRESVTFRVEPAVQKQVEEVLSENRLRFEVMVKDLQTLIDKEKEDNKLLFRNSYISKLTDFRLDYFHTYEEISSFMDNLAQKYPDIVEVKVWGTTYEFHEIKGVKLGFKSNVTKPAIWIDSGIHAREWVSPAVAVYMIYKLTVKQEIDSELKDFLTKFDWYILPVANPDGYLYTWWTNRLWRKNRALPKTAPVRYPWNLFSDCLGTDPNRNFDVAYGGSSTSSNPCSEIFRGDFAFSEKETQAIRDAVLSIGSNLKAYISFHAYSQMWMYPYGYTAARGNDTDELAELTKSIVQAVRSVHGQNYRYGPVATTIYPTSGSSSDWAYDVAKVKYSFICELRDKGSHGFLLPRQEILPTSEETWEGVKVIARALANLDSQKQKQIF